MVMVRIDDAQVRDAVSGELNTSLVGQPVKIVERDTTTAFPIFNSVGDPIPGSVVNVTSVFTVPRIWIDVTAPGDVYLDWLDEGSGARGPVNFDVALRDSAKAAATSADASAASADASRVAAEAAQAAAEALEAGTADWSQIQNRPTTFTPAPHNQDASTITTGVFAPARLGSGSPTAGKVLYGDGAWRDAPTGGPGGGTAGVTSINGTFTGNVDLTKTMVGLSNVDNTSDAAKPISTAVANALAGKLAVGGSILPAQVQGLPDLLAGKRGVNDPIDASLITLGRVAPARLGAGPVGDATYVLYSDGVWRQPAGSAGAGLRNEVVVYGDSQVSNDTVYGGTKRFGQILSEELNGVTVSEQGYGGADSYAVAGLAGAYPVSVTLSGGQIPSSGGVATTALAPAKALQCEYEMNRGWLAGVYGYWAGNTVPTDPKTFVRMTPGSAVPVPAGTAFVPERAQNQEGRVAVMMTGGNDLGHGITESERNNAFKAVGRRFGNRFIAISSVPIPAQAANLYAGTEAYLEAEFGGQYLNARAFLVQYGLAWAGITPTTGDNTDIAAGRVPRSLWHTDNIHLNEAGRRVLARKVAQMVTAIGFIQRSDSSAPVDGISPSTPTGLASASITQTTFTLSWTASTDNVGVVAYDIYRNGVYHAQSGTNSYGVTGQTAGSSAQWTVRARDAVGNTSAASPALTVNMLASSDTTAPSVPTGLAASSITSNSATVTWNASTDNVAVAGYDVYLNGAIVGSPTGTTFNLTGLTPSFAHSVRVRALDTSGNPSAQSSALTVTTLAGVTDLVAHWKLDQGTGTTVPNEVSGGPALNLVAGAAWVTPGIGAAAAAVHTPAQGDTVRCNTTPQMFPSGATAFSVTFKMRPQSLPSGKIHMVTYRNSSANGFYLVIEDGALRFGFNPSNTVIQASPPTLTVGNSYTVAVVYSGTTATVYVNGASVLSGSVGTWNGYLADGMIELPWSQWAQSNAHWNDLRIYSKALTSGEIAAL